MTCFKVGINLGWAQEEASNSEILCQYQTWLDICFKNNIKLVRIFLVRWSIDALFHQDKLQLLEHVIKLAQQRNIEVVLVLNHFTDFIIKHFNVLAKDKYIWDSYPLKKKRIKIFFKNLDSVFLCNTKRVLDVINFYDNVKIIELFNEIDLVEADKKLLIRWVKQLNLELASYKKRFIFFISIAHEYNFNFFQNKLPLGVDVHSYDFPFGSAFKNLEYFKNKIKQDVFVGEFAKFSDYSYLATNEALAYFCSGLWGAFLLKLKNAPFHWWWEDFLTNSSYLKVIDVFFKYQFHDFYDFNDFSLNSIKLVRAGGEANNLIRKKALFRFKNLVLHPMQLCVELRPIIKFFDRILSNFSNRELLFRGFQNSERIYFYCEPNNCKEASFDLLIRNNIKLEKVELVNLFTGRVDDLDIIKSDNLIKINCRVVNNSLIRIDKRYE